LNAVSDTFSIRTATNSDCAAVEALVHAVLREYGLTPEPGETDADLKDIEAHYTKSGGAFWVVVDAAGSIVGSCGIHRDSAESCELRKMYLRRDARGHGLGRRLLEISLVRARALGFKRVTLGTASVLKDAIRLYERAGFKPIARDGFPRRCDQAYALEL